MSWRDTQQVFAGALRDAVREVPEAVGPRDPVVPTARFNVYRNNSAVSLTEAVADNYPVVCELVDEKFFTAMARTFVADHLPASPVLLEYGGDFPGFIDSFEPARSLPFLGDVARIEWAWLEAYHSQDAPSLRADALQSIGGDEIGDARIGLHPSTRLVRSDWPAVSIWSAHQAETAAERERAMQQISREAECALIVRPDFDVNVHLIQPAIWQLLDAFGAGATISEAAARLDDANADEFGAMLGFIFSTGVAASVNPTRGNL